MYAYRLSLSEPEELNEINAAIKDWDMYTCLTFRPRTYDDENYVKIVDGWGCSSYVGMVGGPQALTLSKLCRTVSYFDALSNIRFHFLKDIIKTRNPLCEIWFWKENLYKWLIL